MKVGPIASVERGRNEDGGDERAESTHYFVVV
jgi:hypothetical protein